MVAKKTTAAVRLLGTTISLRTSDSRLDDYTKDKAKCTHCRQCVCRSCGRLRRPELSSEEIMNLFRKVA